MSRRIFIAINPIQGIKEKIFKYQDICPDLPVRWTPKQNLHITLTFLGEVKDKAVPQVIEKTKKVSQKHTPFFVTLEKMHYGPTEKKPRMVWITGEKSIPLAKLKNNLEKELLLSRRKGESYKDGFKPHITLGRLRREFKRLRPEDKPEIKEDLFIKFEVTSIDVIQSELRKGGAKYTILQTIDLGKFK
jgi:2'-5' RNA ligase